MGCSVGNCAISGLPIQAGEKAVVIFLTPSLETYTLEPWGGWRVISFPIEITMDDYQTHSLWGTDEDEKEWKKTAAPDAIKAFELFRNHLHWTGEDVYNDKIINWMDGMVRYTPTISRNERRIVFSYNAPGGEGILSQEGNEIFQAVIRRDIFKHILKEGKFSSKSGAYNPIRDFKTSIQSFRAINNDDPRWDILPSLALGSYFDAFSYNFVRVIFHFDEISDWNVDQMSQYMTFFHGLWRIQMPLRPSFSLSDQTGWRNTKSINSIKKYHEKIISIIERKKNTIL